MSVPTRPDLTIIAGSRYAHVVRFREADGTTGTDVSARTFAAQIRADNRPATAKLVDLTVDASDAANGDIVLRLTGVQTRVLQGEISLGGMEFQEVIEGETEPDTVFMCGVIIAGDYTRDD